MTLFSDETAPLSTQTLLQLDSCPVCGAGPTSEFFKVPGAPAQDAVLYSTREAALGAVKADICLTYCNGCCHVYNRGFDPSKLQYHEGYNITLHHSPLYRRFTDALAYELVERYALKDKTILEIACGKGEFLQTLCRIGSNRGIGIDPSFDPAPGTESGDESISYIRDFYSHRHIDLKFDFLVCRHVLDDVPNPRAFVGLVRKALDFSPNAAVYFETPNAEFVFDKSIIWNLIYENFSYFGPFSIQRLFDRSGFKTLKVSRRFLDDQYLSIEAVSDNRPGLSISSSHEMLVDRTALGIETFAMRYEQIVGEWAKKLGGLKKLRRKVVAWGAGARAVSFFNVLQSSELIPYVVDINPMRQGKYLPGTGQLVVSPDFLRDFHPEIMLITNPTFEAEIKSQVRDLGLTCDFLTL